MQLTSARPSRVLSHDNFTFSAVAFRPDRYCKLSRHRDPAPVGVNCAVPVESSLLHCFAIDELPKEGTIRFRPALVNNGRSIRRICSFRASVNFFRYILRPRCRPERRPRRPAPARQPLSFLDSFAERRLQVGSSIYPREASDRRRVALPDAVYARARVPDRTVKLQPGGPFFAALC